MTPTENNSTDSYAAKNSFEKSADSSEQFYKNVMMVTNTGLSSRDIRLTAEMLLSIVCNQYGADAAAFWLYNNEVKSLELLSWRGKGQKPDPDPIIIFDSGYPGKTLSSPGPVILSPITLDDEFTRQEMLSGKDFNSYSAFKLEANGRIQAIVEVYNNGKSTGENDRQEEAIQFCQKCASIFDMMLSFNEISENNQYLLSTLEDTLISYANSLDLHEYKTTGHSIQLAKSAVCLAREMGLGDEEVSIIERGALLHDLGKVIISDTVLLKPGPLSEEEWLIIKQHTHTGYDLLKDINFLKPALDVLHYHHERWDGTGYPQGLIGEQIPLSARIFAVVDVWENLISERPFRPAYSKTDAINFLRQQSGYAFDPCIVKVFINSPMVKKLLDNKPKLLIVDDEPLITSTLERSLRTDFDVYTANSGEDAIRILQQNIFQIILTDQRMPDLTGIQLLRMANKIQPSIVGVLISAYLDTKVLADAINLGNVYGFIEKPWNTMDLHNKLMQISSMSKSVCQ